MIRRTHSRPSPLLLVLSLAFLLTGLVACSHGSHGEEAGNNPAANPSAAPAAPGTAGTSGGAAPAPASGEMAGSPAAPANPASPADTKPVDPATLPAVVARVNGVEIKKEELVKQANQMHQRLSVMAHGQPVPPINAGFYKEVLDGMVAQTLLLQDAKKQGISVTDKEIDDQIARVKQGAPSPEAYQKALAEQGMTEATLHDYLRKEATVQKYVEAKVFSQVTVTDATVKTFYEQNKDKLQMPERVHVRHILIRADSKTSAADREKAKAKAEDLLKQIKNGADFAKLAAENSDDPGSKTQGGDLPWFTHGQMVPPFDNAAFALSKPNELSGVVESPFGYHIIQLVERAAPSVVPFEQAKPRLTEMVKQRQAGEKLQARVQELKSQGKVEVYL
jgi:peptidyl-prolyl cis-trans isomerase C